MTENMDYQEPHENGLYVSTKGSPVFLIDGIWSRHYGIYFPLIDLWDNDEMWTTWDQICKDIGDEFPLTRIYKP